MESQGMGQHNRMVATIDVIHRDMAYPAATLSLLATLIPEVIREQVIKSTKAVFQVETGSTQSHSAHHQGDYITLN